ncbi:gluconolaconase [Burkholderia sp. Nafp2/4-1b]|uniref:SMP-30/gluconolactonase/LRE family protein n=1 Tax=Burkholderia sp. Nafp2/4-1b TaxID=2116686 RepID=UPI000EF88C63|nr:SMP-30/gluconolactonase/LRE family protein [Burkholderia sp. Nafp2/4-1b]RKU00071.1 gluconolaconase [Burkholderia sp. Nafp2/4-1b]
MQVRLVQAANAILGEGPLWCPDEWSLYWVDIIRPSVYRFTPGLGQTGAWTLPESVGCVASLGGGELLLALRSGLFQLSTQDGTLTRITHAEHDSPHHRFNDGAADPRGRFWVGSMSEQAGLPGRLYRFDSTTAAEMVDGEWICPNGIGWNPDGTVMYATDSGKKTIWRYTYSLATGTVGERSVFARFDDGVPDGLAVDAEGCVWCALWDGWSVVRLSPDGERIATISMPVQRPTSVAFGGDSLQTLYVTSATVNVGQAGLRAGPLAGGLFAIDMPVPGLPVARACLDGCSEMSA